MVAKVLIILYLAIAISFSSGEESSEKRGRPRRKKWNCCEEAFEADDFEKGFRDCVDKGMKMMEQRRRQRKEGSPDDEEMREGKGERPRGRKRFPPPPPPGQKQKLEGCMAEAFKKTIPENLEQCQSWSMGLMGCVWKRQPDEEACCSKSTFRTNETYDGFETGFGECMEEKKRMREEWRQKMREEGPPDDRDRREGKGGRRRWRKKISPEQKQKWDDCKFEAIYNPPDNKEGCRLWFKGIIDCFREGNDSRPDEKVDNPDADE